MCGQFSVKSVDGYDPFTDDYSHYDYIYPIKERKDVLDKFKILKIKDSQVWPWWSTTVGIP